MNNQNSIFVEQMPVSNRSTAKAAQTDWSTVFSWTFLLSNAAIFWLAVVKVFF